MNTRTPLLLPSSQLTFLTILALSPRALGRSTLALTPARRSILGIDWSPAPPAESGPPLSKGATRDPSKLPIELGCIFGAYVLSLIVISVALILIGRRLRSSAQTSPSTLDVEMVRPKAAKPSGPSPISAADTQQTVEWPSSPTKGQQYPPDYSAASAKTLTNFSWPSPKKENFEGIDQQVVESDKEKAAAEMERLYAAVMKHDAAKGAKTVYSADEQELPIKPRDKKKPQNITIAEKQRAPMLNSPTKLLQQTQSQHTNAPLPHPMSPTFPHNQAPGQLGTTNASLATPPASPRKGDKEKHASRTSSLLSNFSSKSKRRGMSGIRGLPISGPTPISSPTYHVHSRSASETEPLTPRSPPPPVPPSPTDIPLQQMPEPVPQSIDAQIHAAYRTAHNTSTSSQATTAIAGGRSTQSSTPAPTTTGTGTGIEPNPLPFRALHPEAAASSAEDSKITVLERSRQNAAVLATPMTAGGTKLPYSPYMPFSPITPISPHLVTKAERKARQREEGRGVVKEQVKEEKDLWDSGY